MEKVKLTSESVPDASKELLVFLEIQDSVLVQVKKLQPNSGELSAVLKYFLSLSGNRLAP